MPGVWVRRARLHAADGAPMPTKQISLLLSARDAATVIISAGVADWLIGSSSSRLLAVGFEIRRALVQHVFLDPGREALPAPRDRVPGSVKSVGTLVIAVSIGWIGATGNGRDRRNRPGRQNGCIRTARAEILDHLLDRNDGPLCGEHGFLLDAQNA